MIVFLHRPNDSDWKNEEQVVKKYFHTTDNRFLIEQGSLIIPRFSALPFYKWQEEEFKLINCKWINSYQQHRYIADMQNWYYDLKDLTFPTWSADDFFNHNIDEPGPFVLKGETNSKKFFWNTHMFAADKKAAIEVHSRIIQDTFLEQQKIYIRKYIPLEKLQDGFNGLPYTREYRFFVYKDTILSSGKYWTDIEAELDPSEVPSSFLNEVIKRVQNTEVSEPPTYYVIDVAKTQSGDWIVVELNDGSMSGLSDNDPDVLYSNLKIQLENNNI